METFSDGFTREAGRREEELNRSDDLFDTPAVAAVQVKVRMDQQHVGFAYFNPVTRHFGACEFVDDDQLRYLRQPSVS